jgi:hypothetical protein
MVSWLSALSPGATLKAIVLFFGFLMMGAASAEAKADCNLPLYIQTAQGAVDSSTDSTVNLFLYGLKSAVTLHQGCIVDSMSDAHLGLYIRTLKLINDQGRDASVLAVALAVPLNGIPVYMDDYVLVIQDTDSIEGQVNGLLQSIGETLDRHGSSGQ